MVNSEEGFGNLSRFLFGNVRVDGNLTVRQVDLPPALRSQQDANPNLKINASYRELFAGSRRRLGNDREACAKRVRCIPPV
jgi:hypothetical protein